MAQSHPVWVRGLKPFSFVPLPRSNEAVAPRVGAWIETLSLANDTKAGTSHPVWVRGLKQDIIYFFAAFK